MSLYKAPIVIASIWGIHAAVTSPNPTPKPHEIKKYTGKPGENPNNLMINFGPYLVKTCYWTAGIAEIGLMLAAKYPSHPLAQQLLSYVPNPDGASRIGITPIYLFGAACMFSAGLIRKWSYRALGELFTFQLTIRDEHRLVTTGPYGIVRHPAYAGSLLTLLGTIVTCFAPGSPVTECGILETTTGKSIVYGGIAFLSLSLAKLVTRLNEEDLVLKKEFGTQWDEWAKRVPCKIIPYVY